MKEEPLVSKSFRLKQTNLKLY